MGYNVIGVYRWILSKYYIDSVDSDAYKKNAYKPHSVELLIHGRHSQKHNASSHSVCRPRRYNTFLQLNSL